MCRHLDIVEKSVSECFKGVENPFSCTDWTFFKNANTFVCDNVCDASFEVCSDSWHTMLSPLNQWRFLHIINCNEFEMENV